MQEVNEDASSEDPSIPDIMKDEDSESSSDS